MIARRYIVVSLLLALPASAFAYVDPGSGMLIWQGALAAIGGVIVFVRNPRETFKRFIARFRRK